MKKKIIALLTLMLILTNMLSATLVIKSAFAKDIEDGKNFSENTNLTTLLNETDKPVQAEHYDNNLQEIFEGKSDSKQEEPLGILGENYSKDGWNFNNTSEWNNFTYRDENKTRLIVGFHSDGTTDLTKLEKIASNYQAKIVNNVSIGGIIRAVVVELSLRSVLSFVNKVQDAGLASYIEPNMKVQIQFEPNDPYWSLQWGPNRIEANWAWNVTRGDPSVLVAIVDTGIDYNHPDLAGNYIPLGYDWANNDPDPLDDFGHGTHCAGIIAAVLNNSLGIAGLAQVRIMAEKSFDRWGSGYDDWIANGIVHAVDEGADIISMSFGLYADSEILHEAIKYAYDAGVLLVAAAGNENTNMKLYPACYDEVIAVTATDQYDNKAYFSNWGDWVELAAPGVDIYSTMPTYYVTMNDLGYSMNYDYMSGTSMACPHVAGVAALVWSLHPNNTRDWVRLWLRYTVDDLGEPGFDVYYGFGRINARNAVETASPTHELIAYEWRTPPYVKPYSTEIINATILNFGGWNETNITVELLANGTTVDSTLINFLASGNSTIVSLMWNPTFEGLYNVTLYVAPVLGEINIENNVLSKLIYVGTPIKAVVLHSAGNVFGDIITNWQVLNSEWRLFGDVMIYIDYTTLNKEDITYEDIAATEADVLIISCAYDPYAGWEFTDSEIEAIERYVHEGHGLIATAGTLYYRVPNNNKLAPLFGLNETIMWDATGTDLLHLVNTTHPIFTNVPNPLVFPNVGTALPYDGRWDSNELAGGEYLALGHYQESAIVTYRGLVYISPWLEVIPPYYHHHLQLLYNAIIWSRYQKPKHELTVSLEAPAYLEPGESSVLNATVYNGGLSNETNVELQLLINSSIATSILIPELPTGESHVLSYLWTPTTEAVYNITVYAPPVLNEDDATNNIITKMVRVRSIIGLVVFEEAHFPACSIGSNPAAYGIGGYSEFANYLEVNGYIVSTIDPGTTINSTVLASADVLVIVAPQDSYLKTELDAIENWVKEGGSLLLIGDWIHFGSQARVIASRFNVNLRGDGICDSDENVGQPLQPYYDSTNLLVHPVTEGVSRVEIYAGDGILTAPVEEIPLIVTDYDGTAFWFSDQSPALGVSVMSAFEGGAIGSGRLIIMTDSNIWDSISDVDYDGDVGFYDSDNEVLAINSINWLSTRYEHDIVVSLGAPAYLEPGESSVLNATVYNRGVSNETNVELQLFINDTVVDSVLIPELLARTSYTLGYLWTPIVKGVYNITAYASPLLDEEYVLNNIATKIVNVRQIKHVLFDQTHGTDSTTSYSTWVMSLTERGYIVETNIIEPITLSVLEEYDVFVIPQARYSYTTDELLAIQNFVFNGGGLLVIGDNEPWIYTDLTSFAGITWGSGGMSGITTDITPHPVTAGISSVYLNAPIAVMYVTGAAKDLVRDSANNVMLAVSEQPGKVIGFADEDSLWNHGINKADNLLLANNMIDWLTIRYEHDLAVSLDAPTFIELGNSPMLNATVRNIGLNNETNVRLYLLINDTVVNSTTVPELRVGESYTINYLWSPESSGNYNITVYALPVSGEEYTANNIVTEKTYVFFYARLYVPHEWVGGGDPMGWHANDESWQYTLPFDFPFYSVKYKTVYISSNGLITFTNPDVSSENSVSALAGKLAIAPAWEDWETYDPCDIYIWQNSTHVGIRWFVRRHYAAYRDVVANFETVLCVNGEIRFNYEYNNGTVSATVGISNGVNHILAEDLANLNYTNTIIFTPYPPDVAVVNVTTSASEVMVGEPVDINVTVENQGNYNATFTVTTYASSLNCTKIYLDPSNYTFSATQVSIGYKFNVTVWCEDVSEVAGAQIHLDFNDSIINVTRWFTVPESEGGFMPEPITALPNPPNPVYIHTGPGQGYIQIAVMKGGLPPTAPWGHNGKIAIIEFNITAVPPPEGILVSDLVIDNPSTYLLDPNSEGIPALKENGIYQLSWEALPPPPPPGRYTVGTTTVINLPPDSRTTLTYTWNTSNVDPKSYRIWAEASLVLGEVDTTDNTYTDGIIRVKKSPSASFTFSPLYPKPGENVIFNASASTPDGGIIVSYRWDFGDGNSTDTSDPIIVHSYNFSGLFNVTLTVIDSEGCTDLTWKNVHVFVRDIAIVEVIPSTNQTYIGRTVILNITVANYGEIVENFNVTLYYNITANEIIGTQEVTNLLPNENITLTFMWNTTCLEPNKYNVTAIAPSLLGETNTINNKLQTLIQLKMLGDVNGDGKIDLKDVFAEALGFGATPSDPRWDPNEDINGDQKIDLQDVYITVTNFGRQTD